MADKLFITDDRMLQLLEWAVNAGLARTQGEYLDAIGARAGNIGLLKKGTRGFTNEQILKAAKLTGANVNWIYGLEKNMLREEKNHSAIDLLKAAVSAIEMEIGKKKPVAARKRTK